jgi:hypothetical protein
MKVILWRADDWVAMYFNGRKVQEGHSVNLEDALKSFIGETIGSVEVFWTYDFPEMDSYVYSKGRFPDTLEVE